MHTTARNFTVLAVGLVLSAGVAVNSGPAQANSAVRFLTSGNQDFWPCFSPDGTKVMFSRRVEGTANWELFIVPVAGGEPQKLARIPLPVSATRASWSTQNNLIAFTGTSAEGRNNIWLIQSDGSMPRRLDVSGLSDKAFYPSWFPSGDRIAVMDDQELVIKRIDLARRVAESATDHQQVLTGMPSVSPDGKWIAFAGQRNQGQTYDQTKNSIWLVDEAGALRTLESNPGQGRAPAWSPGSDRLAFESNRGSMFGQYAIFLIDRDGTNLTQVTDRSLGANHAVWSPDGQLLAFSARDTARRTGMSIAISAVPRFDSQHSPR